MEYIQETMGIYKKIDHKHYIKQPQGNMTKGKYLKLESKLKFLE